MMLLTMKTDKKIGCFFINGFRTINEKNEMLQLEFQASDVVPTSAVVPETVTLSEEFDVTVTFNDDTLFSWDGKKLFHGDFFEDAIKILGKIKPRKI